MESKLKSPWTLGVLGFFGSLILFILIQNLKANSTSKDERVKQIEKPEVAGVKTDIPLSREMIENLKRKEEELKEKERILNDESERLKSEEARIKSRVDELLDVQKNIDKSRQDQQKISQETRAKLIKTFEKMQPKKAAAIISNMEDDLAVDLLKSLKEKNVALIFESMAPDRVTVLSSKIAEQKPAVSSAQEEIKGKVPAGKASP